MDTQNAFSLLSTEIRAKLEALSIVQPTPVQQKTIPLIIEGKNLLFQSETGTGKTFAYLLPLADNIEKDEKSGVKVLIVAPTLELSSQIRDAALSISSEKCALLTGSAPIRRQTELLKGNPAIVVGNPARLLELVRLKKLKLNGLRAAVFD